MLQQIFINSPFHNSDRKFAFFMLLMMMMMIVLDKRGLIRCRKMKLLKATKKKSWKAWMVNLCVKRKKGFKVFNVDCVHNALQNIFNLVTFCLNSYASFFCYLKLKWMTVWTFALTERILKIINQNLFCRMIIF